MLQAVQKLRQGMRCCRFHRTGPEPAVGVSLTQCPHLGKVDGWGGVGQGLSTCSSIIKCSFFGKGAVGEAEASAAVRDQWALQLPRTGGAPQALPSR